MLEKATPVDADKLTQLTLSSKAHWGYSNEQMKQWRDDLTISESYILEKDVYLIRRNNEIAGYYSYRFLSDAAVKLDNLFIDPKFMRKGLGKELMLDFLDRTKQTSCATITLDADPHAESFYKQFGFETVDQLETSIPGRYLPVMELSLANQSIH